MELENKYIQKYSFNKLINKAAKKISKFIEKQYLDKKILFVCGPGNNGEDGKLTYKLLKSKIKTKTFCINKKQKIDISKLERLINETEIIFDCIFGTGLNKNISGKFCKVFELINHSKKHIVSVDIPSGINSDSGCVMNLCINANTTLAMGSLKPGYFLIPGKCFLGKIIEMDLDLGSPSKIEPKISLIKKSSFKNKLPEHKLMIHKYDKGHVMVLGGKMAGASRLVAYSARKVGCGLSTITVDEDNMSFYSGSEPGTIIKRLVVSEINNAQVLVIGPGLGKDYNKKKIVDIIKLFVGPIIIDADAISLFKGFEKEFYNLLKTKEKIIITPHFGEFKRVFNFISMSKIDMCIEASKLINNCVLLKGNDTVIAFPNNKIWINNLANNNLATAGTGDLLCGILAGLLAQNMDFSYAILASVWIQSRISKSKNDVVVEDFLKQIPFVIDSLKKNN